jgi:hypothetical protein
MLRSIFNGLVGAITLTAAHQLLRTRISDAPEMDKLGEQAIGKIYSALGKEPPTGKTLHYLALVGDIGLNTLYYSQVGSKRGLLTLGKGFSLGVGAGVGASTLPSFLGLTKNASQKSPRQSVLTIGLYVLGGLAAAAAAQGCSKKK